MDIDELIQKLDAVTDDVIDEGLLKVVDAHNDEAVQLNISQLFSGRDSNDGPLGIYKNERYAALKNYTNSIPGFGIMDWKLTGALYGAWFMDATKFPITFGSTDEKYEQLKQQNEDAAGLDQTNLETLRQDIKPEVQDLFRSFLQL